MNEIPIEPAPAAVAGPGELLRQARAVRALSVEDVAGQLRLSPRQIVALENDDYDGLRSATYVRGYLRNYARLVGVPVDEVLASHARSLERAQPATAVVSPAPPERQATSRDRQVRLATFALVAALVGLMLIWWHGRERGGPDTVRLSDVTLTGPMPQAREKPVAVTPPAPSAATSAVPSSVPEETASAAAPLAPGGAPPAGQVQVRLRFEQDCWVDIRDARDARLAYETIAAGKGVTVNGVAPIRVFLGNAAAAHVEYNGRAHDIRPYTHGVFARFTLGETAAKR